MIYISTRNNKKEYNFEQIMRLGIPDDGGLFIPIQIPKLPKSYIDDLVNKSFEQIAFDIARLYIDTTIFTDDELKEIITNALNINLPLKVITNDLGIFELFHGPTGAFKDFGARFMAYSLNALQEKHDKKVTIVTATSGDTGAAVASAFHNIQHINVFILYPKDRVSAFQEKQIAGLGDNIHALEIDGTFDDCQDIVKKCFGDKEFKTKLNLTSSNSVNFSRLIPQIIYYFEAYKRACMIGHSKISIIVPSGNFGNITGGVYALKMGLPIHNLVAATNSNDVFPNYIHQGIYTPEKVSKKTISNAMDVANPSNIERLFSIYRSTWNNIAKDIHSNSIEDNITKLCIENFYKKYNYLPDPHTAVGISNYYLENMTHSDVFFIVFATAHPYKFKEVIQSISPDIQVSGNNYTQQYESVNIKKTTFKPDLIEIKKFITKLS